MRRSLSVVALAGLLFAWMPAVGAVPATIETVAVLGSGPAGHGGGNETYGCSGFAPLLPACTSGVAEQTGTGIALGLRAFDYTGTLESRVDHLGGSFVLRCDITGSTGVCQEIRTGASPFGKQLVQNCRSFVLGTTTPGGVGSYQCFWIDVHLSPDPGPPGS